MKLRENGGAGEMEELWNGEIVLLLLNLRICAAVIFQYAHIKGLDRHDKDRFMTAKTRTSEEVSAYI